MYSTIITLMTDFGTSDPYVGVMKGVILGINPSTRIVDLGHDLDSYNVSGAAFLLASAYEYFPSWTIHVVVVDPGVGGPRRPLLVTTHDRYFIAPDNGVLTPVFLQHPDCIVREITSQHYFLKRRGATFDGRDVFAPCAAWLGRLRDASLFGDEIDDPVRLPIPEARRGDHELQGEVVHVDRFGNLISNIPGSLIEDFGTERGAPPRMVRIEGREVGAPATAYCDRAKGDLVAVIGGTGFLEIAVNQGDAASVLNLGVGAKVTVEY
jgi:hypothetical protein